MDVLIVFVLIPVFLLLMMKFHKQINRSVVFFGFGFSILLLITKHPDALKVLLGTVIIFLMVLYSEKRQKEFGEKADQDRKSYLSRLKND